MKKTISILAAAVAVLAMSRYPASASLIGTPINLKTAIERHDAQIPVQIPAYQFDPGTAFTVPVLI